MRRRRAATVRRRRAIPPCTSRRSSGPTSHDYFITNLTAQGADGWVKLGVSAREVLIQDPLTGRVGRAPSRNTNEVYLQLAPGESVLLTTSANPRRGQPSWPFHQTTGDAQPLTGEWTVSFLKGGPELPPEVTTTTLKSWTDFEGIPNVQRFAGTARYRLEFDAPATRADDWLLDLGDVRESARVRLNGREVATLWSLPFRTRIGEHLKVGKNILELEVTNLAANRIRDLDQQKVNWKIMREINFVNINYKPFDASDWAVTASGLLGPITLTPLRALSF